MPSLFSHSRTTSSPLKSQKPSTELSDEFGRGSSRSSTRGAVTVPVKYDRNVEKTHTRRSSSPTVVSSLLTFTHTAANLQVRQSEWGSVPSSSLFSHYLSPPSSSSSLLSKCWVRSRMVLYIINAVPRGHRRVSLVYPHRTSCFRPNPQTWTPSLTMDITGHRQSEK